MDTAQALNAFRARLHNVESVEEGIFRGIKRHDDIPYAVFYIDTSGKIEERASALTQFQDRVLGRHYFDSPNDLRWNSYLLLLADQAQFKDEKFQSARAKLEADRNYARKFVITPDELAFRVDTYIPPSETPQREPVDILDRWHKLLSPVGLDGVFGDGDIAPLIRQIATRPSERSSKPTRTRKSDEHVFSQPLAQIGLEHFRRYPRIKSFDFGSVNLIHGVNGVGKTTLLESIEYFYCGQTRRSDAPKNARISGILRGNKIPITTSSLTSEQTFRDRELAWYGKLSLRKNRLAEMFGIYNFLNTDAAVHLAMDDGPISREQDLAALLIGAEAARVWGRIERVIDRVSPERRALEKQSESVVARLTAERSRLQMAENTGRQSDEIYAQLKANLSQLGLRQLMPSKQQAAHRTDLDLAELESSLRTALGLPDLPPDATPANLASAISRNNALLVRAESILTEYSSVGEQMKTAESRLKDLTGSQRNIRRLCEYIESGFVDAVTRLTEQSAAITRGVHEIGGLDPTKFSVDELGAEPLFLAALHRQAVARERELSGAARTAHQLLDAFKSEHSKTEALAQELRAIARQIMVNATDPDECPLCHTRFSEGELAAHILGRIGAVDSAREDELSAAVAVGQSRYERSREVVRKLQGLNEYCHRKGVSSDLTVGEVLDHLQQAVTGLADLKSENESTSDRIRTLENGGFGMKEYERLKEQLLGHLPGQMDLGYLQGLLAAQEQDSKGIRSDLGHYKEHISQLRSKRDTLISEAGCEPDTNIRTVRDILQRRLGNLHAAQEAAGHLSSVIAVEPSTRLETILSLLSVAAAAQERLRLAIQTETATDKSISDAREGTKSAELEQKRISDALTRYRAAEKALDELQSNHSLEMASREALKVNRLEIARIFQKIHAPQEFEVSESDEAPLQRIETKEPIQLDRVSSGQRAAFALSLFLALNARATRAPRLLLIDDPVAHVDDLNTLSFLDYLRDLAVTRHRQIFFATADDKLTALFMHKFSFLGDQFKKHFLTRD